MVWATLRRLSTIVTVAGALIAPATGAFAQAPTPAPPGIGVRLLDGPPDTLDNPRAHEYIIDHLAPGTTILRHIGFSNGYAQPVVLSFYAVAATVANGTFDPAAGYAADDLSSWMTFSPRKATIAPGGMVTVALTIAVPADASAGERYALALGALSHPAGPGITMVNRIGIRVYLSVGAGGAPPTSFAIESMTASRNLGGAPVVVALVDNTGGRALDLSGSLQLTDVSASLSAGPRSIDQLVTLAPGQAGRVTVTFDRGVPDGPWHARLTLTSGLTTVIGTAEITFPAEAGASGPPVAATSAGGSHTLLLVAVSLVVVALTASILFLVVRRRGRNRRTAPAR